jgi:hypothetical protein
MTRGYTWLLIGPDSTRSAPAHTQGPPVPNGEEVRLFARGEESVRVTTHSATLTLHVFGPGRFQKSHDFGTAAALGEFLESFEQQMLSSGWALLDVPDRRKLVIGQIEPVDARRG